jgi:cell division protease FtsH
MDGFDSSVNIIVMAATNRPDVLDPALLRPGRFDRRIILDMPDINDREAILQVHSKNKPLAKDANLRKVAERTPGFSGADLFNLLNEAAILTARQNRKEVTDNDILQSIEKVMLGPERKSHILNDEEKKITAYHEAGHALIAHELHEGETVRKVSIIARGRAAGYTIQLPSEDRKLHPKSYFINNIAVMLGGFVAEKQTFGEVTTGATSDLQKATATAKDLATAFGMSDVLGPRTFGEHEDMIFLGKEIHENRDYSEKTAEVIDQEISKFIDQAYKKTEKVLTDKKETLDKIVKVLLEKETIEQDEFQKICEETA